MISQPLRFAWAASSALVRAVIWAASAARSLHALASALVRAVIWAASAARSRRAPALQNNQYKYILINV